MTTIFAMCLFAFAMSASPGPVNLLALTNGLNFGFRKALPFVTGATLGFTSLLLAVALGLFWLYEQLPWLSMVMNLVGIGFMLYLTWVLFTANKKVQASQPKFAFFSTGFLMQWLNPKAWVACLAGVSTFELLDSPSSLAIFSLLYTLVCFVAIACWAWIGHKAFEQLEAQKLHGLNRTLAVLFLLFSIYLLYSTIAPN